MPKAFTSRKLLRQNAFPRLCSTIAIALCVSLPNSCNPTHFLVAAPPLTNHSANTSVAHPSNNSLVDSPDNATNPRRIERSLDLDATIPSAVDFDQQPIEWLLKTESTKETDSPIHASGPSTLQNWVLSVSSASGQRLIEQVQFECAIPTSRFSSTNDSSQEQPSTDAPSNTHQSLASCEVGQCKLSESLAPGVYEIRLQPSKEDKRWTQLLPWDRDREADESVATYSWPLIVLPGGTSDTSSPLNTQTASQLLPIASQTTQRRLFVRWNSNFQEDVSNPNEIETGNRDVLRNSLSWIALGESTDTSSPARQWAARLRSIDRRLQKIQTLDATGIVIEKSDALENRPNESPNTDTLPLAAKQIENRYVESKSRQMGIAIGQVQKTETAPSLLGQPPHSLQMVTGDGQTFSVADFRRDPASSIRGRFAPALHAAKNIDLVWFGAKHRKQSSNSVDAIVPPASIASPLSQADNFFSTQSWLTDWCSWAVQFEVSDSVDRHGLIVDEQLLKQDLRPSSVSIENATKLWRTCWLKDSQWISSPSRSSTGKATSAQESTPSRTSSNRPGSRLVRIRQATVENKTVFVCISRAPWAMRVTLPLGDAVTWDSSATSVLTDIPLAQPSASSLGATVVIPPMGVAVCQTSNSITRDLTYLAQIDGGSQAVAQLTREVTQIVSHLGLLGELASMTQRPTHRSDDRQSWVNQGHHSRQWVRQASDRGKAGTTRAQSWGASFWSSDRWSIGHSVASNSNRPEDSELATSSTAIDQLGLSRAEHSSETLSSDEVLDEPSCRNLLINGGFETPYDVGVPGWMHSQHPADAVEIDHLVRHSGMRSMRLSGKDARGATAWLISRDITPPETGRLGVALTLRGEPPHQDAASLGDPNSPTNANSATANSKTTDSGPKTLALRVALEGQCNGKPVRHSETIQVPTNGQWQSGRIVLQWLDIDLNCDSELRLAIDNLSDSSVWIDDIVVTDYFASQAERSELQSLAYLAVQGLQHSELTSTARLLKNFWAQELLRVAKETPISSLTQQTPLAAESTSNTRSGSWDTHETSSRIAEVKSNETSDRTHFPGTAVPAFPKAMWNAATDEAKPASPPQQEKQTQSKQNVPDNKPTSISRRIRRWVPSALRF
ncbi:hypothetical protein SAMN06265222_105251 [Neorhodopirellula lusitana]|uniref:Uncharacterized protein n=1 Tax=Neorhodopirellula lusitana TaxID=445327 RepID=A0ABY1Q3U3_9BACT|nr:hypothetical protein SAMN06265222_105251 [Neorhodopirellula lusitana]